MDHLPITSLAFMSFTVISSAFPVTFPQQKDHRNITAEPGDDTTLPCRAPDISPIVAVVWKRTDIEAAYVLLYRNGKIDPEHQHSSFKNRVDLKERQLKDGDVSLILKNVTTNDRGTYECRVAQTVTNNNTRETINIINLDVQPPPGEADGGTKDGYVTLWVALGLIVIAVLIAGYFFKTKKQNFNVTPPEEPLKNGLMDQKGATELSDIRMIVNLKNNRKPA